MNKMLGVGNILRPNVCNQNMQK